MRVRVIPAITDETGEEGLEEGADTEWPVWYTSVL